MPPLFKLLLLAVIGTTGAALLGIGCNDESREPASRTAQTRPQTQGSRTAPATPAIPRERAKVTKNPDGSRTFTFPSGGSMTKPPAPDQTEVRPGGDCDRRPPETGGSRSLPPGAPRPGLRAELRGTSVRVFYTFADVPDECRPVSMVIAIATSTGPELGQSKDYDVSFPSGSETIPIPEYWQSEPDTVSVGATTADGTAGPTSTVRIQ